MLFLELFSVDGADTRKGIGKGWAGVRIDGNKDWTGLDWNGHWLGGGILIFCKSDSLYLFI